MPAPLGVDNVFTVAFGSLANAESTGAKTVKSPPLSVSTRFTFGLSLPETAATSVVSSGLLEAAVATGSWAMPLTDPAPAGTFLAYAAQPGPTRSAAGSAMVLLSGVAGLLDGVELDESPAAVSVWPELLPPQAAVRASPVTTAVAAAILLTVRMVMSLRFGGGAYQFLGVFVVRLFPCGAGCSFTGCPRMGLRSR